MMIKTTGSLLCFRHPKTGRKIGPVSYVTLRNWVSMFTLDFINLRWHEHNAISLDILFLAGLSDFMVCYLGHMLYAWL